MCLINSTLWSSVNLTECYITNIFTPPKVSVLVITNLAIDINRLMRSLYNNKRQANKTDQLLVKSSSPGSIPTHYHTYHSISNIPWPTKTASYIISLTVATYFCLSRTTKLRQTDKFLTMCRSFLIKAIA